jgi:hypothetical protein
MAVADQFDFAKDFASDRPVPQDSERIELEDVMKESLRAPRIPREAITIDPIAVTASPSAHPPRRNTRRWAQAAAAFAVGITVSAGFSYAMGSGASEPTLTAEPVDVTASADLAAPPLETSASEEAALPELGATAPATPTEEEEIDAPTALDTASDDTADDASETERARVAREVVTARATATASRAEIRETAPSATPSATPPAAPAPAPAAVAPPAPAEPPRAELTREDVVRAMDGIRADIEACAAGGHGMFQLSITVSPSGRVTTSLVEGAFVGTPEGSCMARTGRRARFPAFEGEAVAIRYPYRI